MCLRNLGMLVRGNRVSRAEGGRSRRRRRGRGGESRRL